MRQLLLSERASCLNCFASLLSDETHTLGGSGKSHNLLLLESMRQLCLLVYENVLRTGGMRGIPEIPGEGDLHGVLREDLQKVQGVLSQATCKGELKLEAGAVNTRGLLKQVPLLGMLE